nr:MerR family transcriptional regulator [Kineosphaera limosa]
MSIGDFARFGQVSVRMLRHYDAIGLLTPAHVDPWTGYRSYSAEQLARLNRLVALKDLGFTLEQVGRVLADEVNAEELRGMLQLRAAQLETEAELARARLSGVEHRLQLIEKENQMSNVEYVVKPLTARTIAARPAIAGAQQEIESIVSPLFGQVAEAIEATGGCPQTGVGTYEMTDDGLEMLIGYDYAGAPADGFELHSLPAVEHAVCAVHLGEMKTIDASWQALIRWSEADGWTPAGPCREIYVHATPLEDQSGWVTELQQPVVRS